MNTQSLQSSHPDNLNLGVIGNCSFSALINTKGRICWSCLPYLDSDPVFCSLINGSKQAQSESGFWDFELVDFERSEQKYIENTAVLETILYDKHGGAIKITDLAPRYMHYGRYYKPTLICRTVEPLDGLPQIRIRLRPRFDYGATKPQISVSSNSIRYISPDMTLRLTTDAPTCYIQNETAFLINKKYHFIFGADEPVAHNIEAISRKYKENTIRYWQDFTRGLAIPFEWQSEIIRAAITLKLCTFEETGAIVVGMTSSIPEAPSTTRNYDYRYCWLRDAQFVVTALNRLETTRTMEDYMQYIRNIMLKGEDKLSPLYRIGLSNVPGQEDIPSLNGYRGMAPVRRGQHNNDSRQNDSWGGIIISLSRMFFDKRLTRRGTIEDFHYLEPFGEKAIENYNVPDSGIWEHVPQEHIRVHTFSSAMCWAACDRLGKIATHLGLQDRAKYWGGHAKTIHNYILENAWNEKMQTFTEAIGDTTLDASLLLLHDIGFIDPKDPRFIKTVDAVGKELDHNSLLYRFRYEDFMGLPKTAFVVCTFWYIDALAAIGRTDEARARFEFMLGRRNHVGLLSEDMDFETGELWGNFPQTYSMVGLINTAMRLSKKWHDEI